MFRGKGTQFVAAVSIYSAHEPPDPFFDVHATRFPDLIPAINPFPPATTIPLPSIPGVKGYSGKGVKVPCIWLKSDGLIGAIAIFTK